jgi:hypothetical protein
MSPSSAPAACASVGARAGRSASAATRRRIRAGHDFARHTVELAVRTKDVDAGEDDREQDHAEPEWETERHHAADIHPHDVGAERHQEDEAVIDHQHDDRECPGKAVALLLQLDKSRV